MLILNINGPMNSGKTTVSKIFVNLLPKATFKKVVLVSKSLMGENGLTGDLTASPDG